ncbi:hypothetical protein B0H19DRAFT_1179057 [Mycena capillaripes]|nr:hypothetical protein B0H19DRAFT_1179057 [Mycena capillaripes]
MAPRRRCPVCRSKQWHKEPSSGLIACSEGHILQNYRKEVSEVEQMGPHSVKKRTLKSTRQKNTKTDQRDAKLYHGNKGRYFYFQCLQLILRHQIAVLIERWALPPELEVVCRDLWALHLSLLREPPPAEPYLATHESDDEDAQDNRASTTFKWEEKTPSPDWEDPKASSSDGEADNVDDLLAENSASESSSDGENEDDIKSMPPAAKSRKGLHKYEQPVNTLAVIVLACWTLRVPILYRDLTRLIESYELPYLEATRVLPQSMTVHLTRRNIQALSLSNTPNALTLHNLVSSLARRIYSSFGILTPEANAAPILWRAVRQCLGGGPTLYRLTKRLSTVLSLPLTLHHSLAPRLPRIKPKDSESHKYDNVAPELAFVATGIIVLKVVYGLDGKQRLPADSEDPACDLPRVDEYLELLRGLDDADMKARASEFDSRMAMRIEDLSDDTVDEYLSFCERALVGPANDELERYFPLPARQTPKSANAADPPRPDMRAMELRDGEEEGVLRPGEGYTLCDAGEMPEEYAAIVGRAAGWVGVKEEYLRGVVQSYERRVWRDWLRIRRGQDVGEETDE